MPIPGPFAVAPMILRSEKPILGRVTDEKCRKKPLRQEKQTGERDSSQQRYGPVALPAATMSNPTSSQINGECGHNQQQRERQRHEMIHRIINWTEARLSGE